MTPTGLEKASDFFEISYYRPVSDAKSDAEIKAMLTGTLSDSSFCQLFAVWYTLGSKQKEEIMSVVNKFVAEEAR